MAKRNFANTINTCIALFMVLVILTPNTSVSGSIPYWVTVKSDSFRTSQFENFVLYKKTDTKSSYEYGRDQTKMQMRAHAYSNFYKYGRAYVIANWDTSKSGVSGRYYANSGEKYQAIINFNAAGQNIGSNSYLRVTATLRASSGQVIGSAQITITDKYYDGSYSIITSASYLNSPAYLYLDLAIKVYAYTPAFSPYATSNVMFNSKYPGVPGEPEYQITLTNFQIQQEYIFN